MVFRYWSNHFNVATQRLLNGAPPAWPSESSALTAFSEEEERELVPCAEAQAPALRAMRALLEKLQAVDAMVGAKQDAAR